MAAVQRTSSVLFHTLLSAYPREFRQRFGAEMADTFAQQLSFETQERGLRGLARVWNCAIRELFSVALPLQIRNSRVVPLMLSFVLTSVLFIAFFRAIPSACMK